MGLARYIVPPSGAKGRDVRELHGRVGRELRGKGATETIAHSKPETVLHDTVQSREKRLVRGCEIFHHEILSYLLSSAQN